MKTTIKSALVLLAIGASAWTLAAQDAGAPPTDNQRPPRHDFGGMNGHRPPTPPVMEALDVNHDGVIDANEIANASTALKTLDKNGDGKLTFDEVCPPRPRGAGG